MLQAKPFNLKNISPCSWAIYCPGVSIIMMARNSVNPPNCWMLARKKTWFHSSTFCGPKLVPWILNRSHVLSVFLATDRWTCCPKSSKLHAKRRGPLGWPAFGCGILAGFEMHSGGAIPAKVVPKGSVVIKKDFSPLLMVSGVLHNSIASGLDEDSWGTLCIPISCCISIRDTDAVETQALAISCHKEQGMDLLGSLFAKGHRHQRFFEALEVEWLEAWSGWKWDWDLGNCHLFQVPSPLFGCDIFDHGD